MRVHKAFGRVPDAFDIPFREFNLYRRAVSDDLADPEFWESDVGVKLLSDRAAEDLQKYVWRLS